VSLILCPPDVTAPFLPSNPLLLITEVDGASLRRCLPRFGQWDATKQHHVTLWVGDLNYRVEGNRKAIDRLISQHMLEVLHNNDQLARERAHGRAFRNFEEGMIAFPPTFKYDFGGDVYDTSAKQRVPSWTDRVQWKVHRSLRAEHRRSPLVKCLEYKALQEVRTSDHK
jgi:inositol polyphosphate 5-phosphatase INPP5E